jgi:hypothetical protein
MDPEDEPRTLSLPEIASLEHLDTAARRPVLIRGLASKWPAVGGWSPESFRRRFGACLVSCTVDLPHATDGGLPYDLSLAAHRRSMRMDAFLDILERSSMARPCYMNQVGIDLFPGLRNDVCFADLGEQARLQGRITVLWLGSEGTRSGFHIDQLDNFVTQIHGRKQVLLAAPEMAVNLYPFLDVPSKSRVDPERPDLARFPAYRRNVLYEATLEPGDVLYLPRLWWHYFRSLSRSITLSHWYGAPAGNAELEHFYLQLGSTFRFKSRLVNGLHYLRALLGAQDRRLYAPPSEGTQRGQLTRARLRERWERHRRRARGAAPPRAKPG